MADTLNGMETSIVNSVVKLHARSGLEFQNSWARQVDKSKKPMFMYASTGTTENLRALECFGKDMDKLITGSLIVSMSLNKQDFTDLFKATQASGNLEKGHIIFFLEFSEHLDTGIEICDANGAEMVKMTAKLFLDNLGDAPSKVVAVCLPAPITSESLAKRAETALKDLDQRLSIIPLNSTPIMNKDLSPLAIGIGKAIMLLQGEDAKGTCGECEFFSSCRCGARKRG